MCNEYALSNICFQLLLILCKVKALDSEGRELALASYVQGYGIGMCWVLCHPVFCGWRRECWKHCGSVGLFEKERENYSFIIRFAK